MVYPAKPKAATAMERMNALAAKIVSAAGSSGAPATVSEEDSLDAALDAAAAVLDDAVS